MELNNDDENFISSLKTEINGLQTKVSLFHLKAKRNALKFY